jgi:hypothetical protein
MFEVNPIQDKPMQEKVCSLCGMEFLPEDFCYSVWDEGKFSGVCQFNIYEDHGEVHSLISLPDADAFQAMFTAGRAALNFIDLCDVHLAYYTGEVQDEGLIKAIGFRQNEQGKWEMDLTGFFTKPCSCKSE